MANQTTLLSPPPHTRPCPLLLPPPSRIVCSSRVGSTPRTDIFHCPSVTHHRHQLLCFPTTATQQNQAFSKNKLTKLYGSPNDKEDRGYCSTKKEEESKIENKEEVDESRKWSSIKKVFFLLYVHQYLLCALGCATIAMNPLIRAFLDQTFDNTAVVNLFATLGGRGAAHGGGGSSASGHGNGGGRTATSDGSNNDKASVSWNIRLGYIWRVVLVNVLEFLLY